MNLENKENLSNYQLLKRKPSLCSTSLPFSKLITVVQFFIPDMVSIKFWREKFSRPATGYECIAHALAFDRGGIVILLYGCHHHPLFQSPTCLKCPVLFGIFVLCSPAAGRGGGGGLWGWVHTPPAPELQELSKDVSVEVHNSK